MSLTEHLQQVRTGPKRPGPPCGIAKVKALLPEEERAALDAAIADPERYSQRDVAEALDRLAEERDDDRLKAHKFVVGYHRRGDCACARDG